MTFASLGCGTDSGPDPVQEKARVTAATDMRSYFVKAGGNFANLSEADKAAFTKLAGGAENATKAWSAMQQGSGGSSTSAPR
jgi:hypothetical protein